MSCMKEKYTEKQELLYSSYRKLLEARDILLAIKFSTEELKPFVRDRDLLARLIDHTIEEFEWTELFKVFELGYLYETQE